MRSKPKSSPESRTAPSIRHASRPTTRRPPARRAKLAPLDRYSGALKHLGGSLSDEWNDRLAAETVEAIPRLTCETREQKVDARAGPHRPRAAGRARGHIGGTDNRRPCGRHGLLSPRRDHGIVRRAARAAEPSDPPVARRRDARQRAAAPARPSRLAAPWNDGASANRQSTLRGRARKIRKTTLRGRCGKIGKTTFRRGCGAGGHRIHKTTLRRGCGTRVRKIGKTTLRARQRRGRARLRVRKICNTTLRGPATGAGVTARPRRTPRRHQIRKTTLADGTCARSPAARDHVPDAWRQPRARRRAYGRNKPQNRGITPCSRNPRN
jgi:hypothetical protein